MGPESVLEGLLMDLVQGAGRCGEQAQLGLVWFSLGVRSGGRRGLGCSWGPGLGQWLSLGSPPCLSAPCSRTGGAFSHFFLSEGLV
jgi:hypothetical protein